METSKMIAATRLVGGFVLAFCTHAFAVAADDMNTLSEQELMLQVNRLQAIIDAVRQDLDSVMTQADQKRLEAVVVKATPREDVEKGVYTSIEDGQAVVRVGLGYMTYAQLLGNAGACAVRLQRMDSLPRYMNALVYDAKVDADLREKNQRRKPPLTFCRFLELSNQETARLQKETLSAQTAGVYSAVALAIAHEMGHCALGHATPGRQTNPNSEAQRQQWELDADVYAFSAVSRLTPKKPEYRIVTGLPMLAFLSYVNALRSERQLETPVLGLRCFRQQSTCWKNATKTRAFAMHCQRRQYLRIGRK